MKSKRRSPPVAPNPQPAGLLSKAVALHQSGQLEGAEFLYRHVLSIDPRQADALHLLGVIARSRGDSAGAMTLVEQAIAIRSDVYMFHNTRGNALKDMGCLEDAVSAYGRALTLNPDSAEAHNNLGAILLEQGKVPVAMDRFRRALSITPEYADACANLANALRDHGDAGKAFEFYERALMLQPDNAVIHNEFGIFFGLSGDVSQSLKCFQRALALRPDWVDALNNLGTVLKDQCKFDEATTLFRRALMLKPTYVTAHSNFLFCLNYHPDLSAGEIFEEYRQWNLRHAKHLLGSATYGNAPDPQRRIRVGYVSPDFRRHAAHHFIAPLFANHRKDRVEVFAYADVASPDDISEQLRGFVDHWCCTFGLSDEAVAKQIRTDAIDILVDLAGHTRGNRLLVFARKPAPIQVSWLGYAYTTGLESIDYFLADRTLAPEGSEHLFSEKVVRLPVCLAYRPPVGLESPGPLPALRNGYVTFGSFSRSVRINQRVVKAWAEVLACVPKSRLIINSRTFSCAGMRQQYIDQFGALGIAAERLELGYDSPPWSLLQHVDIGLDCFPHNSGTTLFENLFMGVPFVTLKDRPSVGRMGAAILTGLGHPEWITRSEPEYVAKAVEMAANLPALIELRAGLRQEMAQSGLMDEKAFACSVETAYREMWNRWCDGLPAERIDVVASESPRRQDGAQRALRTEEQGANIENWLSTALSHHRARNLDQAEPLYRQVLAVNPQHASALHLLGVIAHQRGQQDAAFELISKAIVLNPEVADYHSNLGNVLKAQGQRAEAVACYGRATALKPDFAMALSNLGNTCREMGRLEQAVEMCEKALASDPTLVAAYLNLGNALADLYRGDEALASYRRGLTLEPENPRILLSMGIVLADQGWLSQARVCLEHATALEKNNPDALNNLGVVLKEQCRFDDAVRLYAAALAIEPNNPAFASNRLYCLNYHPDLSAEKVFDEYQQWNLQFARLLLQDFEYGNHRDVNRRLRIGYVSPDFRRHAARHFIEPLLARHDKATVEVFAYAEVARPDEDSERLRGYVDCWRGTVGLSDEELASQIRDDGIDILVDLAGHTQGNRLQVFARKPAPIQVSWLGYAYTTGLEAIDYFLADRTLTPAGCEHLFSEKLVRLPVCLAYRPGVVESAGSLPAHRLGHVTFGSLSRSVRINYRVVKAWAEILVRVPDSRLVVNSRTFVCPELRHQYVEQFGAFGIAADRLELGYDSPPWGVLQGIDIGLDCFPHSSGTTLFESLYMGVPFVSLKDRPSVGRMGAAILTGLGRTEWIAETEADYVDKAVALAADLNALAALRAGLREEMKISRLMDEAGFARSVEAAYRAMWQRWCDGEPAEAFELAGEAVASASPAVDCQRLFAEAVAHHQAGHLAEAEKSYRQILSIDSNHADSYHLLGVIAYQVGRFDAALGLIGQALARRDDVAEYHSNFGETLRRLGRFEEALPYMHKALALEPEHTNATINLGALLADMQQFAAAEPWMRKAVAQSPGNAGVHYNFGLTLKKLGRFAESRQYLEGALALCPDYVDVWFQIGAVSEAEGGFDVAAEWYERVLARQPDHVEALNNLGVVRNALGQAREAETLLRRAADLKPGMAEIQCNLGIALSRTGKQEKAMAHLQQAIALNPSMGGAYSNMATVLNDMGRVAEAARFHLKALELEPQRSASNRSYSIFLWRQWRFVEARHYAEFAAQYGDKLSRALGFSQMGANEAYLSNYPRVRPLSDEALAACPNDQVIWAQRLYTLSYHSDLSAKEIFAEFVRWGDGQKCKVPEGYANSREPGRRLRVGFVSPDFRRHTSRFYFAPLFEHYDRDEIEFIAYANVLKADDWTEKFKGWVDGWRDIRGLSDEAVAEQIRADGIDILIDGCNHMQDHRLGVFTFKPAPIQVTWLGAAWTTGLPTLDYVLFDPHMAPEGTLARERIVRLPGCFIAYRPPEDAGEVAALPALKNGYITFGYSGRSERLNHRTFRVWGEILKQLPNARLILDYGPFADPPTQAYYREFLAQQGVDVSRVEMRKSNNIFAGLGDIDILLDCFPHSGGTMLFDALWMGVPALTLASRPPVGRIGTSLMMNLGLPEWVTRSEEEYITQAVALAQDVPQLVEIRAGMRERMRHSPLMDERGFAQGYVTALRKMWRDWCAVQM